MTLNASHYGDRKKKGCKAMHPRTISLPRGLQEQEAAQEKDRHCLKCDEIFKSNGKFNCICPECTIINERNPSIHSGRAINIETEVKDQNQWFKL